MNQQQVKDYLVIRKNEKNSKRNLNVEIASGVVDLLMDLADEVFDLTRQQSGGKMTKGQWREFSGIFIEGKKCSLRKIKSLASEADGSQLSTEEGAINISPDFTAV